MLTITLTPSEATTLYGLVTDAKGEWDYLTKDGIHTEYRTNVSQLQAKVARAYAGV